MTTGRLRAGCRFLLITLTAIGVLLADTVVAAADPTPATWLKLRMCESSDRYDINTGNGYYGAYQFDLPTWRSVGGQGRPDQAAPVEQDYRALYLYRMRGWQPWTCARLLGLAGDSDARSKQVPLPAPTPPPAPPPTPPPTPTPPPPPAAAPSWPGLVYAYGDCAPALRTFQLRMNAFGYGFEGTGCYYAKTRQAVLDLQRANGINDSGRLGPKTWRAAWEGRPPR